MKDLKRFLKYLTEGFGLANKSLVIYLVSLIFVGIVAIPPELTSDAWVVPVIFLIFLIMMGFIISQPYFLFLRAENKTLDLKQIAFVTLKNTKRLALPLILFFIILAVFYGIFTFAIMGLTGQSAEQLSSIWKNPRHPIIFLSYGVLALITFSPVLFTIENKGFFKSLVEGVKMAFKNWKFVLFVFILEYIPYFILSFLPTESWGQLLNNLITYYYTLVLTATTVLYYLKVIKK